MCKCLRGLRWNEDFWLDQLMKWSLHGMAWFHYFNFYMPLLCSFHTRTSGWAAAGLYAASELLRYLVHIISIRLERHHQRYSHPVQHCLHQLLLCQLLNTVHLLRPIHSVITAISPISPQVETFFSCQQTRDTRFLMKQVTKGRCEVDYVCFEFLPRHQNVIRFRMGE